MADAFANIDWKDVVGEETLADGGMVGSLLTVARVHIDDAVRQSRLTKAQAGEVYVAMIPAAFQEAMQFVLGEQLSEANIDIARIEADIKASQLIAQKNKDEAELEKHWGYDVTRATEQDVLDGRADAEGDLMLGASTGIGKIDEEVDLLQTQDSELLDNGVVDRDIKERQIAEQESTGEKQRTSIDKDNLLKDDDLLINIKKKAQLDADTIEKLDGTIRANTQLEDQLLTSEKQRVILDTEEEIKQYEHDVLQLDSHNTNLKQVEQVTKQIDVSERTTTMQEVESSDKLVTSEKQRILLDEEKESADLQQVLLGKDALLKDEQIETENKNQLLLDTEEEVKTAQLGEIVDGTARANTELTDKLLTTGKQRLLMDEEVETADLNQIILQTEETIKEAQLLDVKKSTDVKERTILVQETELSDKLVTAVKQRLLLDTQEESEQYRVDNILPKELDKMVSSINVSERQMLEAEATGISERAQIDKKTLNLDTEDILTITQIGKLKIDAEVAAVLGAKDADLKEQQTTQISTETKVTEQKIVGRKQSAVLSE